MSQPDLHSLESLQATWRSQPATITDPDAVARDAAQRARRMARRLALLTAGELLLTLVAFRLMYVAVPPHVEGALAWWGLAALHTMCVWGLVVWSRRPVWGAARGALLAGSDSFGEMLRERLHRRLVEARWIRRLVVVEAFAATLWFTLQRSRGVTPATFATPRTLAVPALSLVVAVVAAFWYERRARRDDRLQRERDGVER